MFLLWLYTLMICVHSSVAASQAPGDPPVSSEIYGGTW